MSQAQSPSVLSALNEQSEEQRIAYMKSLGAINMEPPLTHSTHLKNKTTGLILPWNEILAEQRDIMECCDANGNTDPAVWMRSADMSEYRANANEERLQAAQTRIYQQATAMSQGYQQPMPTMEPQPVQYPQQAVPLDQIPDLMSRDEIDGLLKILE